MRVISHLILCCIVIVTLNGCFFSAKEDQRWELEPKGSTSFALSRDGRFGLLYSQQDHLVLWDLKEEKQLTKLGEQDSQASSVSHIRFSDNGRFAITATQTNFAIWDLTVSQADGLWSISDGVIRDIDVASTGEQVLLGLSNGKAIFIDLVTGRRIEFLAHQEKVNTVALSPNGRYALTGGNDYKAYFWDTRSGQALHVFEHPQRVNRVAFQRDGKLAFSSDGGNDAYIWDIETGNQQAELKSFSRQLIFSTARFSDDGSMLITGSPSGRVQVWDTSSGDELNRWDVEPLKDTRPPRAVVYDAAFDSEQRIISASSAGIAQAWKL